MPSQSEEVKVFKASKALQKKAGTGRIDEKTVLKAQGAIDNTSIDFYAMARDDLDNLKKGIADAMGDASVSKEQLMKNISAPLLHLKSSAPLFEFHLVGTLASIMFNFIQKINAIDDRALQIISAHHKTLYAIISNKMTGDGGAQGAQLKKELTDVCKKYFSTTS